MSWSEPLVVPAPAGVDRIVALVAYEGDGARLVVDLKHRNHRGHVGRLASALAGLVDAGAWDVVTWAPTSPSRRRRRGFDQAELLARAVAGQLHLPCRRLLRRAEGPAQTGRRAAERSAGVALTACGRAGPRTLVVDDVCTTGSTLAAAATALRTAGAVRVGAAVVAWTPPPGGLVPHGSSGGSDRVTPGKA